MTYLISSYISYLLPDKLFFKLLHKKIIFYGHLISDDKNHLTSSFYQYPSIKNFTELVKLLKSAGYIFVSFKDFKESKEDSKLVTFTFDDGFIELYKNRQILEEFEIPYTLFLLTDPLEGKNIKFASRFSSEILELTPSNFIGHEEINQLKKENVTIGFHSRNHLMPIVYNELKNNTDYISSYTIPDTLLSYFDNPLLFSFPYFVDFSFYSKIEEFRVRFNYKYIFDTRGGFKTHINDFYTRVSIDSIKGLKSKNISIHSIKTQFIISFLSPLNKIKIWK